MGIICLEIDSKSKDSLKKLINDDSNIDPQKFFLSSCRVVKSYIKLLSLVNIKFMPVFYTNND